MDQWQELRTLDERGWVCGHGREELLLGYQRLGPGEKEVGAGDDSEGESARRITSLGTEHFESRPRLE